MPSRILRLWNPDLAAWEEVGDSRLTTHAAAADPHPGYLLESLVDAKGDVVAASADNAPARLAVGTNGQVLTADSTQTLGLRWVTPTGGGLPTTGGTMTGPILAQGGAVDSGGALAVTSPATPATDLRTYGSAVPAFGETIGSDQMGLRFTPTVACYLVAVRWYRVNANGNRNPAAAYLYDTTNTATPVWSFSGTPPGWTDTALGWKEYRLPGGTQPLLVAGRAYVVSYSKGSSSSTVQANAYTPTPDAGLTFGTHLSGFSQPPTGAGANAFGIDAVVRTAVAASTPGGSGAVRLPNGAAGGVTWRNGADAGDLALFPTAADVLTFNGSPVQTQTTADARYLQTATAATTYLALAGGTLTGDLVLSEATPTVSLKQAADTQPRSRLSDTALAFGPGGTTAPDTTLTRTGAGALRVDTSLGVGVNPAAWNPDYRGMQVGTQAAVTGVAGAAGAALRENNYIDAAYANRALGAGPATVLRLTGGQFVVDTAPAVGAGAVQTFTARLQVAQPGDTTPGADNAQALGGPSARWSVMYAATGTINTSSADLKQAITPLDPAAALAAVLNTDPVVFDYTPPERDASYYELPDDPEQAEPVLHQRLTSAPLEAAARHQAGFVLASPDYATDPLFETGEGQSNAANSVGVILAALHAIDARLTAGGL